MKKTLYILIILFIPFVVNAKISNPNQIDYEATPFEDIKLYDLDGNELEKIPTGEILTIDYEKYFNEESYGATSYNGIDGYVKLSDIVIQTQKISLNDLTRHDGKKIKTLKDIDIYKGPSIMYGKIDSEEKLPKNTEVTYYYSDDAWAYIDMNGTTGWIYIYQYEENKPYKDLAYISLSIEEIEILTTGIVTLVNNPIDMKELDVQIPVHTELKTSENYIKHENSNFIKVEYNGQTGWFEVNYKDDDNLAAFKTKCYSIYVTNDTINFYSRYNNLSSKASSKILQGTELEVLYMASVEGLYDWYYIKYKGEYGWILGENYTYETTTPPFALYKGIAYKYTTKQALNIYKNPAQGNLDKTIPASSSFIATYSIIYNDTKWLYVKYNDIQGWVKGDNIILSNTLEQCLDIKEVGGNNISYEGGTEEKQETTPTSKPVQKQNILTKIIPFAFFAIIISVLLILYKKGLIKIPQKKKATNKVEEQKQNIEQPIVQATTQPPIVQPVVQVANQTTTVQPAISSQPNIEQNPTVQQVQVNPPIIQSPVTPQPVVQQPVVKQTIEQPTISTTSVVQQPEAPVIPFSGITNTVAIEDNEDFTPAMQETNLFETQQINNLENVNNEENNQ